MLPLPVPERGGLIEVLAGLLNLPGHDEFVLVVAWLVAAVRSKGPYPLLAIAGEQGSAKTFLTKALRALIDPNVAPVRAAPREERELFISARNSHLLAFDNLSNLSPWISDALCRLASGGSFAVRRLYTDEDEVLFEAARPVVLNGIEEVITRPDLADRAIFLTLGPIAEQRRRPEKELWREFEVREADACWVPCSISPHMVCGPSPTSGLSAGRGWLILRNGQALARARSSRRGHSCAHTAKIVGRRATKSSRPIQ